jgi:signal transduction histidine kinase
MTAQSDLFSRQSKSTIAAIAVALTAFTGVLDYLTGPHISVSAFYLLPLSLAAWYLGAPFAFFIAVASVAAWVMGNILNHDSDFTNIGLVSWNAVVQFVSYLVVVVVLTRLRALNRDLETRIIQRTAALTTEIAERDRLQQELLNVSDSEQRRIGQELHDGLCQHLAGTALTCQVLREELEQNGLPEAAKARKIVELIEEGISLSRRTAQGLDPVEMDSTGLMLALEELAATTQKLFNVTCVFACPSPVLIHDTSAANHMFRIAQEAVRNAVNHGRPDRIVIRLSTLDDGLELRIEDNGSGLPATRPTREGMGLRLMENRARAIGAEFAIQPRENSGTIVTCMLPLARDGGP